MKCISLFFALILAGCANLTPQQSDRLAKVEAAFIQASIDAAQRALEGYTK